MTADQIVNEAVRGLRALVLAGENYRQAIARTSGLGVTESQALSYLAVHGERGQNDLAADLGITSGASTALVDRLERIGIAERYAHPHDRRRVLVRLTGKGRNIVQLSQEWLAASFYAIPAADLPDLAERLHQVAANLRRKSASRTPPSP